MFDTRADVKSMFEQFRSVEKRDLGNSRSLESHALLVMNALEESIANMDDPEYLIEMLLVDGKSHRRFENFNQSLFWVSIYWVLCFSLSLSLSLFFSVSLLRANTNTQTHTYKTYPNKPHTHT